MDVVAFGLDLEKRVLALTSEQSRGCRQRECHQESCECLERWGFVWLEHRARGPMRYRRQEEGLNPWGSYDLGKG